MKLIEIKVDDEYKKFITSELKRLKVSSNTWEIHNDGRVEAPFSFFDFKGQNFKKLPIKLGYVDSVYFSNNKELETLENGPLKVTQIDIESCPNLKSLKYFPTKCKRFLGKDNHFESLEGLPKDIMSLVNLEKSHLLTDLTGSPREIIHDFNVNLSNNLTSIKGRPDKIGRDFQMAGCSKITTLNDLPDSIGRNLFISGNPLIKNYLRVLKVKDLQKIVMWDNDGINFRKIADIINKHLAGDKDIMECQEEMIEAGFGEYAKLK
jgi:hypothetical protein